MVPDSLPVDRDRDSETWRSALVHLAPDQAPGTRYGGLQLLRLLLLLALLVRLEGLGYLHNLYMVVRALCFLAEPLVDLHWTSVEVDIVYVTEEGWRERGPRFRLKT